MDTAYQTILLLVGLFSVGRNSNTHENADFWMKAGETQLKENLKHKDEHQLAKNVIIFVGDGMGISTVTSARIYKGQKRGQTGEKGSLSFEKFPNIGLSKTYAVDKQVTDSAASATALFCGVKTNYYTLGLDAQAKYNECDKDTNKKSAVSSIMTWAQNAGKDTGFVTTTRVTHATPAALYSHINSRNWECDGKIPQQYRNCVKDIALQLVEENPGKNFKVILGGGANQLGLNGTSGSDYEGCNRTDGRNLAEEWKKSKNNSLVVTTRKQLKNVDLEKTEYLLGLFSPDHVSYAGERLNRTSDHPSLIDMTIEAVKMLMKSHNGFVLMVEGGRIDHAHHENFARLALEETLEFEEAIAAAALLTNEKDTLIIVTADHSHSLTLNGYPDRGNDILGISEYGKATYETLTYANGPGYAYHRLNSSEPQIWRDLKNFSDDRKGLYYQHFSPIYLTSETHGGEDVAVYARGPSSHLLSGVYDHNYIAHAISHAACIGPHTTMCTVRGRATTLTHSYHMYTLICLIHFSIVMFKIV